MPRASTPRRRPLRTAGLVLAGLVVLIAGAAIVAALGFDPNTQKTRITDAVRRATGRELTIAGPISIAYSLSPTLGAQDVAFANRPGGTRPQMVTVARVDARLALIPLLTGRIEIASLTLVRPDILLETDPDGVGNWQVTRAAQPAATDAAPGPSAPRRPLAIRRVTVENGRVTWHDARRARSQAVDLSQADIQATDAATTLVADALVNGGTFHLVATLPPAAQLTTGTGSSPVRLALTAGEARLSLDGLLDLPLTAASFQGKASLVISDLAETAGSVGFTGLPPLHGITADATLTRAAGRPVVDSYTLHLGAADLSRIVAGATLVRLDLSDQGLGQPAHLDAEGSLAGASWQTTAGLLQTAGGVAIRGLDIQSVPGDLQGDLAVGLSPRPSLRGTLVSQHLDLDALAALRPAHPQTPPAAVTAAPAAPASSRPLFSRDALPWAGLRAADADLTIGVDTLQLGGVAYRTVAGHIALRDGSLRIDPASLLSPEGPIDLALTADGAHSPPTATLTLHAPALALDPLAQAAGLPGGSDAAAEIDLVLQAAGLSPHDMAASVSGHAGLAVVDAEIANAVLSAAAGNTLRTVGARLDPAGRSHVRCLAVRLNAVAGQISVAALKLDSTRLAVDATGGVDLGAETLALHLRPTVRLGGAGVMAPIRLDGPLQQPKAALDAPGEAGRPGMVFGGLTAAPDSCAPELTAARDGRAGRLPTAEAPGKPPKPADLLRSFLR